MNEIDYKSLYKAAMEISDGYKNIMKIIPEENHEIIRHLAASSIHMAYFMKDIHDISTGTKTDISKELTERFFNECGCDFNKK